MLDLKSKLVLKILQKECKSGGYKIVEKADIISSLPTKYRMEDEALDHIITFLERSECIHIKYDDEKVYCLCILPIGNQLAENELKEKKEHKFSIVKYVLFFFLLLMGSFLGSLLAKFINF